MNIIATHGINAPPTYLCETVVLLNENGIPVEVNVFRCKETPLI